MTLSVGDTLWETAVQANVPLDRLSRVISFDGFVSFGLRPLGLAAIGPAAAVAGAGNTLVVMAAAAAVLTVAAALLAGRPRFSRPRHRPPHARRNPSPRKRPRTAALDRNPRSGRTAPSPPSSPPPTPIQSPKESRAMLPKKPHLGIVSLAKHADTDAGVIDEGPYTYEHLVAKDVIWAPPSGRLGHGEFSYGGTALRERAEAFLIHFGLSGDPLDTHLLSLSRALEEAGYPVLNSFEFTWTCGDKHFALERARSLGIPTPKTLLAKPTGRNVPDVVSTVEGELSYPLVVKPRGTMKGFGVIKVTDRDLLVSTLQLYSASGMSCLVQEFIESGGREVRCFYAGGELLGIYDRRRDHSKFIGVATPGSARAVT